MDPALITITAPHSAEAEQFRLLKNNILFPEKRDPAKCIMITSTAPMEGKSFVAANLAVAIANSLDEYVLLVDCDLRRPTLHKLFGYDQAAGLSQYLAEEKKLSEILIKTNLGKLTLLPAGTIPHNPSELLSSGLMRQLIKEARQRYSDRFIIFDTPPPYITSEVNALARQVDGVIIVIRNGQTKKKAVEALVNVYGREKILGAVHNFSPKPPGYKYHSIYQYHAAGKHV